MTLADDLRAARALVETPDLSLGHYNAKGAIALAIVRSGRKNDSEANHAFAEAFDALVAQNDGLVSNLLTRIYVPVHREEILAAFDRAIATADKPEAGKP